MATDITLDQGGNQDHLVIDANVVEARSADFELDSAQRRGDPTGHRRALVHDQSDGLTINFNGDYPGGVHVLDARINLHPTQQESTALPLHGAPGDLFLLRRATVLNGETISSELSLWLCVGTPKKIVQAAEWCEVQLGAPVTGSA